MGFFDSGSQETTTTQKMPAWQEAAVRQNLATAQGIGPLQYTNRNLNAAYNPALYAGLNGVTGLAKNGLNGRFFGDMARQGMETLADPNSYQAQFDQGAFDSMMSNTNLDRDMAALDTAYNSKLAQGLKDAGYAAGGFSGNFGSAGALAKGNAVGSAAGDYTSSLAALYGGTRDRALQAGMEFGSQNAAQRLGAANSLVGNAYAGLGTQSALLGQQFGMGGALTALDQAGIDREVFRDMYNVESPMRNALFQQQMAGRMGDYGGTTVTSTPTASPFQQALGAGLGLAGAYFSGGGSLAGMGGMFGGMGSIFGGGGGAPTNSLTGGATLNTPNAWWNGP